jgi:hypothetical protein
MHSLLQIVVQETFTIIENKNLYDLVDKNQRLIIKCLNTIGSQQEISTTRTITYLLNFSYHIIDYDFTYILWYNLLAWVKKDKEKLQNIHLEKIITLIIVLKHL